MAKERIVGTVLMSAVSVLGVVSCPPVPADDSDGSVGGSGTGTGGSAMGGTTPVPVCDTVASLPTMYTACSTRRESQCDAAGNRCVCDRDRWYCNTICASTYPTEPVPDSACMDGAACSYRSGVSCQCDSRWACIGTSSCPTAANMPLTGRACNGLAGVLCDYPNTNPSLHYVCGCTYNYDLSSASWTCVQSFPCPATQPAYDLNVACAGPALCSYGSTYCQCWATTGAWVCGLGIPYLPVGTSLPE